MAEEILNQETTSTEDVSQSDVLIDKDCVVCNTPGYGDQFNPSYPTAACGCKEQSSVGHDPYCHCSGDVYEENLGTRPEDLSELHPRMGAVTSSGKEQVVYKTEDKALPKFSIVPDGGDVLFGEQVQLSIKMDDEFFTANVPNVVWQTSSLKLGYVDQCGVFHANYKEEGEVTITATDYLDKNSENQVSVTFNIKSKLSSGEGE